MVEKIFRFPDSKLPLHHYLVKFDMYYSGINPVEFHGPATNAIFGLPYVALCEGGVKEEGKERPGAKYWVAEQAWDAYRDQFTAFTKGAKQIAWRELPRLEQSPSDGSWVVYSRIYVWPSEAQCNDESELIQSEA